MILKEGDLTAIRAHDLVSSLNVIANQELEIKFINGYDNLIISLKPGMTFDHLMTVFYYYVENYKVE
jgi:hypothetical protein